MTTETIAAPEDTPVASVGSLIDEYYSIRDEVRDLERQTKDRKEAMAAIEEQLLETFDAQGVTHCRGRQASATLSETLVPTIEDWEQVSDWMDANDARYLQERRIASAMWRELHESGEEVPGITPFNRRKINVRKL